MDIKRARSVILNDKDYQEAYEYVKHKNKKSTSEQIVDKVLLPIGYHESKLDPTRLQDKGGPGRGMYQYEGPSLRTALRRAFNVILEKQGLGFTDNPEQLKKAKVPSYMINAYHSKNPDASKLTAGQQSAIAVFDYLKKPNTNIDEVTQGTQTINSFWLNSHWSNVKKSDPEITLQRRVSFSKDYDQFVTESNEPSNRVVNIKQPPKSGNPGGLLNE